MATETDATAGGARELSGHLRGVVVTTLACLVGVVAAVVSASVVGTTPEAATSTRPLLLLGALTVLQFPALRALGVDVTEFGPKDLLYVVFMTFSLWFVTYGVLLTSGATL